MNHMREPCATVGRRNFGGPLVSANGENRGTRGTGRSRDERSVESGGPWTTFASADVRPAVRRAAERDAKKVLTTSSSGSASHPPGSRNAPLLLPLLPPRLLHRRPRPRPPPGQPVRRDVERQPAAVVVADRTGDRGALPQILLRSRRAELHSRGGHAASTRGATEQRSAARRISPGCVSASAVSDEGDPPSPLRTTKIAHSLSLPLANREVLPVRLGHNEFSARPVRWQG